MWKRCPVTDSLVACVALFIAQLLSLAAYYTCLLTLNLRSDWFHLGQNDGCSEPEPSEEPFGDLSRSGIRFRGAAGWGTFKVPR